MKRFIAILALSALCILLCGCGENTPQPPKVGTITEAFTEETDNYPGVDLVVVDGTVTPTSAEIKIINDTGFGMRCYGNNYIRVQKEVDGVWYDLSHHNVPVTSQGPLEFDADAEYHETVYWEHFYDALSPGHYRIVKKCSVRTENNSIPLLLTAEFDIE